MNKKDLIRIVSEKADCPQKVASEVLNAYLDTIEQAMSQRQRVVIPGFGTFEAADRAGRTGRNPSTGEPMAIPARVVPRFIPGKQLKEAAKLASLD